MNKISIFLSTLMLFAIMLTACGTSEANQTPGAGLPTMAVETPQETAAAPATETPLAGDGTTTPGIPLTGGDEDPARLSNLLDFGVWNENGEQIGDVNDMVLDLDNTRISYVIVGVGGFLGLGEKDVLVPWDSLRLQAVDAAGGQENGFIFEGDQERFTNAPDWDLGAMIPAIGEPAGDWDDEVRSFWESGALPPTPDPNATATAQPEATSTPETEQGQSQPQDLQGVILATDALGATITTIALSPDQSQAQATATPDPSVVGTPVAPGLDLPDQGQVNATVDDIIVDPETGEILYIVLDALFDDGERWIPVPLSFLQWDPANEALIVNVAMDVLQNAPSFLDGEFPDTSVEGWNDEFDTFWANPEAGTGTGAQPTPTP